MAKAKKQKTIKQQAKSLHKWSIGLEATSFLSFFAPFITIAIVNKDKYFIEYDGTKTRLGFIIAMIVMGFGLIGIMSEKIKSTYLIFVIKWITFAFAFTLLGQIITDIAVIMWYGLIGIVASYGLDLGSKQLEKKSKNKLDSYNTAMKNKEVAQAEQEIK